MLSIIELDRENDVAYILVRPELRNKPRKVAQSLRVAGDVVLDLDDDGQLIGIELLKASSHLDLSTSTGETEDLIVGVKEAADMFGVEKSNFVRDFANREGFPSPLAELASGRFWLRSEVQRYLDQMPHSRSSNPSFKVGDLVCLRGEPTSLVPIIEVIPGGPESRYRVFQNGKRAIFYERQLQRAPVPAEIGTPLTARQLHSHLTSFHILSPSTSNLFSLRSGRVHFVPYQYRPVLKLIRADRPRLLVADEVGIGKTIESGLIIKELGARLDLASILVICPKALVAERKWATEMRRFDEQFAALDGAILRHCLRETDLEGEWPDQYAKAILPFSLFDSDLVLGRADRPKRSSPGLLELNPPPKFDLVIVDEAHHIRNPETYLHQGVRYFCDNAHAVLLLTATPVQLGSNDLFTLLNVLRPDLVIDRSSFDQMAAPNKFINKAIQACRAARPAWETETKAALTQAARTEWGQLFLSGAPAFTQVIERLGRDSIGTEERITLVHSVESLYTFSSLINRTRRRDIGEFTTRKPETLTVEFTGGQRRLHDSLLDVVARIFARCHGHQSVKFMMTTLRRQAASCLYGLAPLLEGMLAGKLDQLESMEANDNDVEPDMSFVDKIRSDIRALLNDVAALDQHDPKVEAFLQALREKSARPNNKALVFSTFRHTLAYLYQRLRDAGMRVALVHGDIPDEERVSLRRRFELAKEDPDAVDILLSSEVGCEGLDFQFCDLLVNYDLPWNPMRIEQRIGRIDRYGQQSQVVAILNLITPGTVDADIYERCLMRIGVFQHAVGGNEEILGQITRELHSIAESLDLTEAERSARLQQLADNTIRQMQEEQELEKKQSELFGLEVPRKSWRDELKSFETFWLSPSALESTVKTYLAARLDTTSDHLLGDKALKTLRLNQDARAALLEDLRALPRTTEPAFREWERYLRGSQPTVAVTFDQATARESVKAQYLSVLHPLVKQAARFLEIAEPKQCALAVRSDALPAGVHHFALYRWTKQGVKADELLVAVARDGDVESRLLDLLQDASEAADREPPGEGDREDLDKRHHGKWAEARTRHVDENKTVVGHRIQSLAVSHRARCGAIEDQIRRATNEKIRLMKESELTRANADFQSRMSELQETAGNADIQATPLVFGTLSVRSGSGK